ncbi:hypothetical protein J6590_070853 [Homalodisca vitripennis]|nr:hypothetical protein J6590_070853 [Homalodisca vitripennis]
MLVQFHEITYCIATRFRLINVRIRQEVIIHSYRHSMRHHGPLYVNHREDTRSIARIKSFMISYQILSDAAYQTNTFYSDILTSLFFCKFVFASTSLFVFFLGFAWENLTGTVLSAIWALCHICYLLMIVSSSSDVTQAADETAPIICKLTTIIGTEKTTGYVLASAQYSKFGVFWKWMFPDQQENADLIGCNSDHQSNETLVWVFVHTKRSPGAVDVVQASGAELLHLSWIENTGLHSSICLQYGDCHETY